MIKRKITNNSYSISRETIDKIERYFYDNKKLKRSDLLICIAIYNKCVDYAVYSEGGKFENSNIERKYGYFCFSFKSIENIYGISRKKVSELFKILIKVKAIEQVQKPRLLKNKALPGIYLVCDMVNAEIYGGLNDLYS